MQVSIIIETQIMGISMIGMLFFFCITMVTLQCIHSQFSIAIDGVEQVISLLENVTDTSTAVSSILPRLRDLLHNQQNVQTKNNLLLTNQTTSANEMINLILQVQEFLQHKLENEQWNHVENTDLLRCQLTKHEHIIDLILAHMSSQNTFHNDSMTRLDSQHRTLEQVVAAQARTANTLARLEETHRHVGVIQMQTASTQAQMLSAMTDMRETQTRVAKMEGKILDVLTSIADHQMNQLTSTNRAETSTASVNDSRNGSHETNISNNLVEMTANQTRTLLEISHTQTQILNTQTQMANAFNHMTALFHLQTQQFCRT